MRTDGIIEQIHITEDEIIAYCKKNLYPENVFTDAELSTWAEDNGYVKSNPTNS